MKNRKSRVVKEEEEEETVMKEEQLPNPQDFQGEGTSSTSKGHTARELSQPQNDLETNLSQQKCEECSSVCEQCSLKDPSEFCQKC